MGAQPLYEPNADVQRGREGAKALVEALHLKMSPDSLYEQVREAFREQPTVGLSAEQQKIWNAAVNKDARDPRGAQLRSAETRARFLSESRNSAKVAEYLNKKPATIRAYTKSLKLASFIHEGKRRYPAWQFSNGHVVPGLESILPFIPATFSARATAGFFTNDQFIDLFIDGQRVSPVNWLWSDGDPEDVVKIARDLGHAL